MKDLPAYISTMAISLSDIERLQLVPGFRYLSAPDMRWFSEGPLAQAGLVGERWHDWSLVNLGSDAVEAATALGIPLVMVSWESPWHATNAPVGVGEEVEFDFSRYSPEVREVTLDSFITNARSRGLDPREVRPHVWAVNVEPATFIGLVMPRAAVFDLARYFLLASRMEFRNPAIDYGTLPPGRGWGEVDVTEAFPARGVKEVWWIPPPGTLRPEYEETIREDFIKGPPRKALSVAAGGNELKAPDSGSWWNGEIQTDRDFEWIEVLPGGTTTGARGAPEPEPYETVLERLQPVERQHQSDPEVRALEPLIQRAVNTVDPEEQQRWLWLGRTGRSSWAPFWVNLPHLLQTLTARELYDGLQAFLLAAIYVQPWKAPFFRGLLDQLRNTAEVDQQEVFRAYRDRHGPLEHRRGPERRGTPEHWRYGWVGAGDTAKWLQLIRRFGWKVRGEEVPEGPLDSESIVETTNSLPAFRSQMYAMLAHIAQDNNVSQVDLDALTRAWIAVLKTRLAYVRRPGQTVTGPQSTPDTAGHRTTAGPLPRARVRQVLVRPPEFQAPTLPEDPDWPAPRLYSMIGENLGRLPIRTAVMCVAVAGEMILPGLRMLPLAPVWNTGRRLLDNVWEWGRSQGSPNIASQEDVRGQLHNATVWILTEEDEGRLDHRAGRYGRQVMRCISNIVWATGDADDNDPDALRALTTALRQAAVSARMGARLEVLPLRWQQLPSRAVFAPFFREWWARCRAMLAFKDAPTADISVTGSRKKKAYKRLDLTGDRPLRIVEARRLARWWRSQGWDVELVWVRPGWFQVIASAGTPPPIVLRPASGPRTTGHRTVGIKAHRMMDETARPRTFRRMLGWLERHPRQMEAATSGEGLAIASHTYLLWNPGEQRFEVRYNGRHPLLMWNADGTIQIRLSAHDYRGNWTKGLADRLELLLEHPVSGRQRGRWQLGTIMPIGQETITLHESELSPEPPLHQVIRIDPRDLPLSRYETIPVPPNVPANTRALGLRAQKWGPTQQLAAATVLGDMALDFVDAADQEDWDNVEGAVETLHELLRGTLAPQAARVALQTYGPYLAPGPAEPPVEVGAANRYAADRYARRAISSALRMADSPRPEGGYDLWPLQIAAGQLISAATEMGGYRVSDPPARRSMIGQRVLDELWRRLHLMFHTREGWGPAVTGARKNPQSLRRRGLLLIHPGSVDLITDMGRKSDARSFANRWTGAILEARQEGVPIIAIVEGYDYPPHYGDDGEHFFSGLVSTYVVDPLEQAGASIIGHDTNYTWEEYMVPAVLAWARQHQLTDIEVHGAWYCEDDRAEYGCVNGIIEILKKAGYRTSLGHVLDETELDGE